MIFHTALFLCSVLSFGLCSGVDPSACSDGQTNDLQSLAEAAAQQDYRSLALVGAAAEILCRFRDPPFLSKGIYDENACSYMNSVVSSLAAIGLVAESFYHEYGRPSTAPISTIVYAFVDAFSRLNSPAYKKPVVPTTLLQPAIIKDMGWEFGSFRCVLEFWDHLLSSLPPTLSSIFSIKTYHRYMMEMQDGELSYIGHKNFYRNILLIAVGSEESSLSRCIANSMAENKAVPCMIKATDAEAYPEIVHCITQLTGKEPTFPCEAPIKVLVDVIDRPQVLAVGLKRNFPATQFKLDETIVVSGAPYRLQAFIANRNMHYFSFVRDSSKEAWKMYSNELVALTSKYDCNLQMCRDQYATLAFYVQETEVNTEKAEDHAPIDFDNWMSSE